MNSPNFCKEQTKETGRIAPQFSWDEVDRVFLDMDGTLLDKYYDDYFWEQYVPEVYAERNKINLTEARQLLLATYKQVESTLQWTDLDYWSERLGLDIVALKKKISHLINAQPNIVDFFRYMKSLGKELYLVTNAHPKTLEVKMSRVNIEPWFDQLICSKEVGAAKEQPEFWRNLQQILAYDEKRTLFADDTEKVLHSAREAGIRHLIHIAKPSSKLPVKFSATYPSITGFQELIF